MHNVVENCRGLRARHAVTGDKAMLAGVPKVGRFWVPFISFHFATGFAPKQVAIQFISPRVGTSPTFLDSAVSCVLIQTSVRGMTFATCFPKIPAANVLDGIPWSTTTFCIMLNLKKSLGYL